MEPFSAALTLWFVVQVGGTTGMAVHDKMEAIRNAPPPPVLALDDPFVTPKMRKKNAKAWKAYNKRQAKLLKKQQRIVR